MKRYAIWNKTDNIITPAGEVLTPEQWIERHPVAESDSVTVLCHPSAVNGGAFGILELKVAEAEADGCDFSDCNTAEEKLARYEAFLDAKEEADRKAYEEAKMREDIQTDSLVSIAASMEYQNMMTLPDVEE